MTLNKFSGFLLNTLGVVVVIFAVGELLLRIACALGGIYLINLGMQRMGYQPLHWTVVRMWFRSRYTL